MELAGKEIERQELQRQVEREGEREGGREGWSSDYGEKKKVELIAPYFWNLPLPPSLPPSLPHSSMLP